MCSIFLTATELPPEMEPVPEEPADEGRPLEELENEICELMAEISASTCRWLLLLEEFDRRSGWASPGTMSCAHWLSWRCGIGIHAAREHVRVARVLVGKPLLTGAFASGQLSYSKVRALTRVVSAETEASLVEMAQHATGAQLEKLCRSYGRAIRASQEAAHEAYERQRLQTYWNDDGTLTVEGRLSAEDGVAFLRALEREEPDATDPVRELGSGAVRAQALMRALHADTGAAEVVVHVDAESLESDNVKERSELQEGPAISPQTARRLACDGSIVRIIERDGAPLSVGRRTRAISPALRRALRSRDAGCRFPGCTHTRHLHAHHIHHWARGGETDIDNLVQLCSHHHRLVHEGGFTVEAAGGGVVFRNPHGRVIEEHCGARPARGPAIEVRNRLRGVSCTPATTMPRSAGDSLDYGLAVASLARRDNLDRKVAPPPMRE